MSTPLPTVAVLGASGLIGQMVAEKLTGAGLPVAAVARRFAPAQVAVFGARAFAAPPVDLSEADLTRFLRERGGDVVMNCIGALQDSARGSTREVHVDFVERLLKAVAAQPKPVLLVHVSIPGRDTDDATPFSRTKREAERLIAASGLPHVILRPGFVIAPAAYGGSALFRALAATPFALAADTAAQPFAAVAVEDIGRTVEIVARRWGGGERRWSAVWDLCERIPSTVGTVVEAFRRRFGGPAPRASLPGGLLRLGARCGDLAARLGWSPPVRSTALAEMRRGVEGDPRSWIAATGIEPRPLAEILGTLPANVQERWFARLYLAKPLLLGCLALFWTASGLIALFAAFAPAAAILTTHGFPIGIAQTVTAVSSLADIAVGVGILLRRTCRAALSAGIGLSLFYMAGAAVLAPDLWIEPLGALVKTFPAIVLMFVAILVLDER